MKIYDFEDLECWQVARKLAKRVYILSRKKEFFRDFKLSGQIHGSAGSAMDNIAEGFERGGNKEFIQFLFISKASNAEVRSQLYRALDVEYIDKAEFDETMEISLMLRRLLKSLIESLERNPTRGTKNQNYNH
ncbi:four helix bundle protein [Bacteroidota bacterium]